MRVLLIGSGGREHALALALKKSESLTALFCTPGNPGINQLAERADINPNDFNQIAEFCKAENINLVVPGPELPLSEGIADYLGEKGIRVFGPVRNAARLESSKSFAKDFMKKYDIPTAPFMTFSVSESAKAHDYIDKCEHPAVIKADGLAAGKGVIISSNSAESHRIIDDMFGGMFGDSGKTVVIEGFLRGEEASILAITDGSDFVTLASSQDHKRIYDGDQGPNTGGMGAYSPAPVITEDILLKVKTKILEPALAGMRSEGTPFVGCLYAGLMINEGEPSVVEFNVRFGDPETQAVLSVFDGDFADLLMSAAEGKIDKSKVRSVQTEAACCVVVASGGYPGSFEKGFRIRGIEEAESVGSLVFHAGTSLKNAELVTSGGRVLGVTATGVTLEEAINKAYKGVSKISFDNAYFRKDIGKKGLIKRT